MIIGIYILHTDQHFTQNVIFGLFYYLEIVRQFCSSCIPRIHCNKHGTTRSQRKFNTFKHEAFNLQTKKDSLMDALSFIKCKYFTFVRHAKFNSSLTIFLAKTAATIQTKNVQIQDASEFGTKTIVQTTEKANSRTLLNLLRTNLFLAELFSYDISAI